MKPLVSVIAPIYNEKKTLEINIEKIRTALADYSHEIIIVDDNSPDGSGEIADSLAKKYNDIKVGDIIECYYLEEIKPELKE